MKENYQNKCVWGWRHWHLLVKRLGVVTMKGFGHNLQIHHLVAKLAAVMMEGLRGDLVSLTVELFVKCGPSCGYQQGG